MYPGNYYYDTTGTALPSSNTLTTCTANDCWYLTQVSTWKTPAVDIPKWWRWFDVFRTWAKPKLLRLLNGYRQPILRVQERYPEQQRARTKRRAYVQALRALTHQSLGQYRTALLRAM